MVSGRFIGMVPCETSKEVTGLGSREICRGLIAVYLDDGGQLVAAQCPLCGQTPKLEDAPG